MSTKRTITGRELRRGTPEETLAPGEALNVKKQGGKRFELRRVDGPRSVLAELDELLKETGEPGEVVRTDLARIICEDRE